MKISHEINVWLYCLLFVFIFSVHMQDNGPPLHCCFTTSEKGSEESQRRHGTSLKDWGTFSGHKRHVKCRFQGSLAPKADFPGICILTMDCSLLSYKSIESRFILPVIVPI